MTRSVCNIYCICNSVSFLNTTKIEVGPAVGRLRKIYKKVPDRVVHTVKLGRLINIVDISTDIKKLFKSKDGTGWDVHFPSRDLS